MLYSEIGWKMEHGEAMNPGRAIAAGNTVRYTDMPLPVIGNPSECRTERHGCPDSSMPFARYETARFRISELARNKF
jgi:hypothetical protein